MNINLPTVHQVAVVGTHVAVAGATAIGIFGYLGMLTPHDAQQANHDIKTIIDSVENIITATASLIGIGVTAYAAVRSGPIGSLLRAASAIYSSPKLAQQAQAAATPLQAAQVNAVANTIAANVEVNG